jgi:fatty-acyl-CoA synthase
VNIEVTLLATNLIKEQQYLDRLKMLWEKNWPAALPKELQYPFGEVLITDYLQKRAELTPDKPCIIWYGTELTFKQLDELSSRFATFLAEKGMQKGDRIAVFLPTCPQFHIAFYGILKLGCIHVPVNPMFKEQELLYELNDTQAKLIITLEHLYPMVEKIKEQTSIQEIVTTSISDFLPEHPTIPVHPSLLNPKQVIDGATDLKLMLEKHSHIYPKVNVSLDDIAALNYTGGTTGMPKGCAHTQRNMVYTCASMATYSGDTNSDNVVLSYLPSFWIAGENTSILSPVFTGKTHILLGRWDAEAMLIAIDKYKVTHTGGVLDNFVELMERPDVNCYDLSSIKSVTVSSYVKKMNIEYRRRWQELSGSIMRESSYGMTETHTFDTFTNYMYENDMDLKSQPIFVGLPMPGTEFKIVDFDTGKLVPLGEEGEIVIRTPSLFKSYWNKPEETEKAIRNGWFYTGDIGMIDEEGYLHFLGRKKEMLKVKGMSVYPPEIEAIICRHPAVIGCGVVGMPHEEKGEVPVAYVQMHSEAVDRWSEEDLQGWCREQMAVYKVPVIKIIEELPLTATGKVKKEELKKLLPKVENNIK